MKLDLNEVGSTSLRADFTIVGGGTVGLVVATELARRLPTLEIIVIESGNEFYEPPSCLPSILLNLDMREHRRGDLGV